MYDTNVVQSTNGLPKFFSFFHPRCTQSAAKYATVSSLSAFKRCSPSVRQPMSHQVFSQRHFFQPQIQNPMTLKSSTSQTNIPFTSSGRQRQPASMKPYKRFSSTLVNFFTPYYRATMANYQWKRIGQLQATFTTNTSTVEDLPHCYFPQVTPPHHPLPPR